MITLKITILSIFALGSISWAEEKTTQTESKPLSKEVWNKYFSVEHQKKDQTWRVKMNSPLLGGSTEAKLIQKFKGEEDGWVRLASVFAGGPWDGQQDKRQLKVTEKGLITEEEGTEAIAVPFPLAVGQSWEMGDTTVTVQGFEDYETPTQTLPKCIVLKTKSESGTTTRWFSADHGYFFSVKTRKNSTSTLILDSIK